MASATIELHPGAIEDIEEGRAWYQSHNPVIADAFIAEVDHAMFLVAEAPDRWPRRNGHLRSLVLAGFPYTLFYLDQGDTVVVLAVAADCRKPGYWMRRR